MINRSDKNSAETMKESEKDKIEVKFDTDGDQVMLEDDAEWNVLQKRVSGMQIHGPKIYFL